MIISILSAVIIFGVLIIVHETGHFLVAKRSGVRVIRYSVGYPPKIFGIRRGETEYAFGALPLGGYVRMLGDEVAEEPTAETLEGYVRELQADMLEAARRHGAVASRGVDPAQAMLALAHRLAPAAAGAANQAETILGRALRPDEALLVAEIERRGSVDDAIKALVESRPPTLLERYRAQAFPTQSLGTRIKIVLAGPLANIMFAPLLMAVVYMYGVPYVKPVLGEIKPGMPAYAAGLRKGDQIIAINGRKVGNWADLSDAIKSGNGAPVKIDFVRPAPGASQSPLSVIVTPRRESEDTGYGNKAPVWIIGVLPRGDEGVRRYGPVEAVYQSVVSTAELTGRLVTGIALIINGTTPARQALGGPIMIAKMAGKEAKRGFAEVAGFTVMLSLELGIINLLPIPLLDGGHLFFFLIEGVRGKPLQLRHREFAMQIGLLLLVALMTFVIVNDLSHIMHS
ncbi:MAG TPA: RIP metalloprotease RseP [Candidatus Binataceae bacterium]|jgi:regulator of sigma E protease|nr:RIP metalloprotease RseP [Candidatus Binataceae bacterium]